eukprot:5638025-Pleurochrysis_carterae.AAC.1
MRQLADSMKSSKCARAEEAANVGKKAKNAGHSKSAETIELEQLVESILTTAGTMYGAHVKALGRQQAIKMLYELAEKHNRFEGIDTNVLPSIYRPPVHELSVENIVGLCKFLELGEPHLPTNNVDK